MAQRSQRAVKHNEAVADKVPGHRGDFRKEKRFVWDFTVKDSKNLLILVQFQNMPMFHLDWK